MMKASDIMTEEVATIRGSATVAQAVKLMKLKNFRSLIVERRTEQDAYGIITDVDIASKVVAFGKDSDRVRVYEVMTKPCTVINPDLGVEYVARLLAQAGLDRAPVIRGELLGIISTQDILMKSDFLENPRVPLLEKTLQEKITEARAICAASGEDTAACTAAWEMVAEVEAELAFCTGKPPAQYAVEEYNSTPTLTTV
jgi:CBS domain-containing protein